MADRNSRRGRSRRRNGFLDLANGALSLLVLGILVAGGVLFFGLNRFYSPGPVTAATTFMVEPGNGMRTVAERLREQGLIENEWIFQAGGYAMEKQRALKAGKFNIPAGASMADILQELTEGEPIQIAVTIPEGYTSWQVVQRLNDVPDLTGEIEGVPAEGSILPNTYDYLPGDTRQSVLEKMQAAMSEELAKIWETRDPDLPIETPEDLVTLASVVEKETGVPGEREQVAAVFVNRLKSGMRLQSDPTIIYGITLGRAVLGRGLRRSEIEAETPYNTYKVDGLPAGPIANPGVESLRAAANPADTADLYFVAAGPVPSDGHLFADNYDDHRRNVARYREIEAERDAAAEDEAQAAKDEIEAAEAAEAGNAAPANETATE